MKIWQKAIAVVSTFALLFNSIAAPLTVLAQEATPSPTPEATVQPTDTPTPTDPVTPTPEATIEATATHLDSPVPTAEAVEATTTPEVTPDATPTVTPETTPTPTPSPWTFENVELNKEYVAPQNSGVKLTFTKLPSPAGNIKIEEITLTQEQIQQSGSLSDKAYDITSDMTDGSFSYNLSLPIPESSKGKTVEVKFAEELSNIGTAEKVENTLTKTDTSVSVASLDHFTIFVVTHTVADCSGGVYAAGVCYATIQAAVDAATGGETISIAAGTYDEQVVIDGKNLTLQGAGDTTIIRPSVPATLTLTYLFPAGNFWAGATTSSIILVKNAGAVTIKDLKVDGAGITSLPSAGSPDRLVGVLLGKSSGTIDNVTVNNIKTTGYLDRTYGIQVSGASTGTYSVEVKNSHVNDWARNGIVADGANLTANINHNTLVGPGTISGQVANGILFIGGAAGNATSNTISGMHYNADSSRTAGILVFGSTTAGILIDSNDISDTDDGIDLSASSHNATISNNNLHNNLEVGIQLENGTADNTITGNTIVNNTMAGIRFGGAGDPIPAEADTPPGAGNVAHSNTITGNTKGIVNYDTGLGRIFDATNNWWGTAVNTTILSKISGNVTYAPYYVNSGKTILSNTIPTSVYVDDNYTDGSSDSHAFGYDAFVTIQEGINTVASGETVNVAGGTYNESQILIDKPLTLQGAGYVTTIINGGNTVLANPGLVRITASGAVTLSGFTIQNTENTTDYGFGVYVNNGSATVKILDNAIKNFGTTGINVNTASSVQIEGNIISAPYSIPDIAIPNGIQIGYPDGAGITGTIKNNEISGCSWINYNAAAGYDGSTTAAGILIMDATADLEISNNDIYDNNVGIDIEAGVSTNIENNNIYDNAYGVVSYNQNPSINNNKIENNSTGGVYRTAAGDLSGTLNATSNWWGNASGPGEVGSGTGDKVSVNVSFSPWYINAGKTTLSNLITVTFDKNGGTTEADPTTRTANYNTTVTLPTAPTKTGYAFDSWKTAADGSGTTFDATTAVTDNIIVYAKWTVDTYTVTFNANGKTGGTIPANQTKTYDVTLVLSTNSGTLVKTGYTFSGWNTLANGTGTDYAVGANYTANTGVTLYAKWTIRTYTVTFNANGSTGGTKPANQTKTYDVTLVLATNSGALVKTGYTFSGWNTAVNGSGTDYAAGANYTTNTNKTLYAKWTINSYTITFDSAGGSDVASITQDFGTAVTGPANPTKEGYTFAGWSPAVPATMPALSQTLTAQWNINSYTITFNSDGGSAVDPIIQNYGTDITTPAAPTKTGYTFAGWLPTVPTPMPATNTTVVAQWTANSYTITFNSAGGSAVDPITQAVGSDVTVPTAPTKVGYTFSGWSPVVPTTMPAGDETLVAQWTVNSYTITFDSAGGSDVASITQDFGTAVTAPTDPTREGYTFNGWSPVVPGTMGLSQTLVAQWVDLAAPTTPTATPIAGDYTSDQLVTLTSSDLGSGLKNIYYTIDGSDPSDATNSARTLYPETAVTVDHDLTLKAIAYDNANNASGILTAVYRIAPEISGESSSSVGANSATITWTTDDLSTSRVIYDTDSHPILGTAPNYGYANSTVEDSTKVTSHSVGLTGLSSGTTYYYRTVSHGSPEAVSAEQSFATLSTGGSGDGLGCANHDCSNNSSNGGGTVLGIATQVLPKTWPKLAYAENGNTETVVLGASTDQQNPEPTSSPTLSPEATTEPVITNPGFFKWILTHKKISGGIALILLAVTYGLYRLSKKNN